MTRKPIIGTFAWIAPGIPVRVRRAESRLEAYHRTQAECTHQKRDPQGTCYACGHREAK
jgi:hypothetical protein